MASGRSLITCLLVRVYLHVLCLNVHGVSLLYTAGFSHAGFAYGKFKSLPFSETLT